MHKTDPLADRPSPHRRGRRDVPPRGGPASSLLQPPQDLPPSALTPRRAQVWIREIPQPAPRRWRIPWLDVAAVLLIAAVVAVLLIR